MVNVIHKPRLTRSLTLTLSLTDLPIPASTLMIALTAAASERNFAASGDVRSPLYFSF